MSEYKAVGSGRDRHNVFVIIGRGKANAILRKAQDCGATGGHISGRRNGTFKFLDAMGLSEIQKKYL